MSNTKLSIRHWKIAEIKLELAQAKALLPNVKILNTKYGYQQLFRKSNQALFEYLDRLGFFSFHRTNCGASCYMHQIVLYLDKGWNFYKLGTFANCGCLETHHIDHNPSNNHPSNLWYVSPEENKALAQACGVIYRGIVKFTPTLKQLRVCPLFRKLEKLTIARTAQRFIDLAARSFTFPWSYKAA